MIFLLNIATLIYVREKLVECYFKHPYQRNDIARFRLVYVSFPIIDSLLTDSCQAYTGIQNAAVDVTRNIQYLDLDLAYATTFLGECIGYLLFIVGGLLLLIGTTKAISAFRKKPTPPDEVQADLENN